MEGKFAYDASLNIQQIATGSVSNTLSIDSDLLGSSMSLPYPFSKTVDSEMPLHLNIAFAEVQQQISGTLGQQLSFELDLEQGSIRGGLVYLGDTTAELENLRANEAEGLLILGSLDRFNLEQWIGFLAELNQNQAGDTSSSLAEGIEFVDVELDILELYDQQLYAVDMRIESNLSQQYWEIDLSSEALRGQIKLPFNSDDFLELDLDYLRLSGDEGDRIGPPQLKNLEAMEEAELVDALAQIDPRQLPKMKFTTDEFRIGDRPYGNWQFTLNPTANGAEFSDLVFDFRGLRMGFVEPEGEQPIPHFTWLFDGIEHRSTLRGMLYADNMADVLTANGYAASLESNDARFRVDVNWPGSPAFFSADNLSGEIDLKIKDGRFLQGAGAAGALKLISILNFDAIMRRLRFSDDLLRSGLAYDEIVGELLLDDGLVHIDDRLVISGPSSLYQIIGDIDLEQETISGQMFLTLPVSENIPWIGLLTANIPLAVGAYLFDRIFGDQVNSLTSAVYTLEGPWDGLEPEFSQAFGSPDDAQEDDGDI